MDKKHFSAIVADLYKSLTPFKASVFVKNEDSTLIRVISEAFNGMTFSARFKMLNDELQDKQPDLFNEKIYIFEAFTSAELAQLSLASHSSDLESSDLGYSESAKEL